MINFSQLSNTFQFTPYQQDSMHRGQADDSIDRLMKYLKTITLQNDKLQKSIQELKSNPKSYINPIRNKMIQKIQQLQNQNIKIKKMIDKTKMPVYSQIKRKSIVQGDNWFNQNINNQYNQNNQRDSIRSSLNQSIRNSNTMKSALSQIRSSYNRNNHNNHNNNNHNNNNNNHNNHNSHNESYDKNQSASTCFNQQQKNEQNIKINPILKLQPLSLTQQEQRQRLTQQINYLIVKTQIFEQKIQQLHEQQKKQLSQVHQSLINQQPYINKIQEYKKKLLRLLNKLKSRQTEMDQIVKTYKHLHQQTIKKLQQSTQQLRQLQQRQIDSQIQQKYQQVLQLQQKLIIITSQLQQLDQQKWLFKVFKQLQIVCRRLSIKIPKQAYSVKEMIDQLCESIIEGHLMAKNDVTNRLCQLKQYQEEEKQNNQRLIQAMKIKEQGLGKKLAGLQMQKGESAKK